MHFELENHSPPIVDDALNQPIAENDSRCILERFHQVVAIQGEPMAVRTPVGVRMVVQMVSEVVIGAWAGGHKPGDNVDNCSHNMGSGSPIRLSNIPSGFLVGEPGAHAIVTPYLRQSLREWSPCPYIQHQRSETDSLI